MEINNLNSALFVSITMTLALWKLVDIVIYLHEHVVWK